MSKRELAPKDAAQRLGVRLDSVYSLIWAGKIEAHKLDGRWRIPFDAIEQRLKQRRTDHGTDRR
jgi:excisionase family DNA binding protein